MQHMDIIGQEHQPISTVTTMHLDAQSEEYEFKQVDLPIGFQTEETSNSANLITRTELGALITEYVIGAAGRGRPATQD